MRKRVKKKIALRACMKLYAHVMTKKQSKRLCTMRLDVDLVASTPPPTHSLSMKRGWGF